MNPAMISGFCRLYSMMLYAYPAGFRREYAGPMKQMFRDRCRDVSRSTGALHVLRFAMLVMTDWLRTTVRERAAEFWNAATRSGDVAPLRSGLGPSSSTYLPRLRWCRHM